MKHLLPTCSHPGRSRRTRPHLAHCSKHLCCARFKPKCPGVVQGRRQSAPNHAKSTKNWGESKPRASTIQEGPSAASTGHNNECCPNRGTARTARPGRTSMHDKTCGPSAGNACNPNTPNYSQLHGTAGFPSRQLAIDRLGSRSLAF